MSDFTGHAPERPSPTPERRAIPQKEVEFNAELKRLGVFGACSFNPRAKRSMFGKLHLIRNIERTAFCGAPRPRGFIDKADHVPSEWKDCNLCPKCRAAFDAYAKENPV